MLPPNTTLFISDLHLSEHRPALQTLFLQFLQGPATYAQKIYILGDLFDAWLGNDVNKAFHQIFYPLFKDLANRGIPLSFMAGNRDFLIDRSYLEEAGIKWLPDPCVIDLHGIKTLLTHGDKLCTQDVAYQRYRRIAQHPWTKWAFLHLPRRLRENMGKKLRLKSQQYQRKQETHILDVSQSEVEKWLAQYKVQQLIHGHVHRPKIHQQQNTKRMVLGDWHDKGSVILSTPNQNALATYCPKEGFVIKESYALETVREPLVLA